MNTGSSRIMWTQNQMIQNSNYLERVLNAAYLICHFLTELYLVYQNVSVMNFSSSVSCISDTKWVPSSCRGSMRVRFMWMPLKRAVCSHRWYYNQLEAFEEIIWSKKFNHAVKVHLLSGIEAGLLKTWMECCGMIVFRTQDMIVSTHTVVKKLTLYTSWTL